MEAKPETDMKMKFQRLQVKAKKSVSIILKLLLFSIFFFASSSNVQFIANVPLKKVADTVIPAFI